MDNKSDKGKTDGAVQKRRLSAIMFTDIKGFTSLMESDEITAVGLVKAQREIIRKHIANHDGEERETIGDAFLVLFDSAVSAVRCAIDIQRDIWEYNQSREPEKQVWVRIGIHLGDILIEEGSVFGEGVNLAARVEPLAEPGGICITRQVYDQVKHHVELSVSRLGVRELKNISDVPDIYRIRISTAAPREPLTILERMRWFVESRTRFAISLSVAAAIVGASTYWTFFATHTLYAKQVARIYHSPVARYAIGRAKAQKLNHYYELSERGGKIIKIREVKKPELLPEDAQQAWEFSLAKKVKHDFPVHEYSYERGRVREEDFISSDGVIQYKLLYEQDEKVATAHDRSGFIKTFENQISSFGFEFDEAGRIIKSENKNAFGMLRSDTQGVASYRYAYGKDDLPIEISSFDERGNPVENKDGIAKTAIEYDGSGQIIKETYYDRYGSIHESLTGMAALQRFYDDDGRMILEKYLNRTGEPIADNSGACAKRFSYDSSGRTMEIASLSCSGNLKSTREGFAATQFKYDGDRITEETFLDENGAPTADSRGIAQVIVGYDSEGRISSTDYKAPDGKDAADRDRVHAITYAHDEWGRPAKRTYIDLDNKPAIGGNGYAEVRVQYNERGDAIEWAYFDPDGALINAREGFAIVRNEFDQFGNLTSKSFFDRKSEPAIGKGDACHRIQMKYDDMGNLSETRCLDGDGKLTPGIKSCAICNYQYDAFGKMSKFECYVSEGKFIDSPNLPSSLAIKYDERGYMSEVRAFDANGGLSERYQGAAIWKRKSDDFGNQIEISTYDRNGELIDNPKYRAAIFRREFDKSGHETKVQAFDRLGLPTTGIWGFAEMRYRYDDLGRRVSESFFDGEGQPALNQSGTHEIRTIYDDRGRVSEVANLGTDGQPTLNTDGVACTIYKYDAWGSVAGLGYLGVDREPIENKNIGAAYQDNKMDDRGNVIEISRYDAQGNLCRRKDCIAITTQAFDSKGRKVGEFFKDADGNPTEDDEGAAGYRNEFDIGGRINARHVIGLDGRDSAGDDGVHEYLLYYAPDSGRLWFKRFADASGNVARTRTGADLRIILYDATYQTRKRAYADVTDSGTLVSVKCLDGSGRETSDKNCATPAEINSELARIKSLAADTDKVP